MSVHAESFGTTMRGLGGPAALGVRAAAGLGLLPRVAANAHIHLPPNFTAFETTAQAVALADAQGVRVLGASNYYDYSLYVEFAAEARRHGIFPLFGLEVICLVDDLVAGRVRINDPANPGKMYLCGKGLTRFAPLPDTAGALLRTVRDGDAARTAIMADKLAAIFAAAGVETGLGAEAVRQRVAARHHCPIETVYLQERHLAQAFQEVLFGSVAGEDRAGLLADILGTPSRVSPDDAVGVQNEIRSRLMKAGRAAFVPDTFVSFDHARRLVLALGGIPCYPMLADGVSPITEYEDSITDLIADLKARGVACAEFIPGRNRPEVLSRYVHALRAAGLFVTAGTEHNTLDMPPLAPACLNGGPIPEDLQEIFWEGVCVVAAHQYLGSHGEPGFVDADGTPNTGYGSDDQRIRAFARLGAEVIGRYLG